MLYSIEQINQMTGAQFVETLGWIFEHSPWVAERAWRRRPFSSGEQLAECMHEEVAASAREEQLALLCAHPDLGTRAKISASSNAEQAGAGLDQLTTAEHARLTALNEAYRAKFGFPFLYAVKGSDKFAILEALGQRIANQADEEFAEALQQVYRISDFRLETVVEPGK
jgi:2-oxo-4-hydroxy-4-carboxy-5-ureidoimidazoline decarboxylase